MHISARIVLAFVLLAAVVRFQATASAGSDTSATQSEGVIGPQHIERLAQELKKFDEDKAKMSPAERTQAGITFSIFKQAYVLGTKGPPAELYFSQGDHSDDYAHARSHRLNAWKALVDIVNHKVDGGAVNLEYEFTMKNAADDFMLFPMSQWTINGDIATAPPPENNDPKTFWMPKLRKIGNDWRIDVTDETDGDPDADAKRAEREVISLESITQQVNSLKLKTLDDVRAALRAADIHGTGKSMQ
jgi:hypothetical protein